MKSSKKLNSGTKVIFGLLGLGLILILLVILKPTNFISQTKQESSEGIIAEHSQSAYNQLGEGCKNFQAGEIIPWGWKEVQSCEGIRQFITYDIPNGYEEQNDYSRNQTYLKEINNNSPGITILRTEKGNESYERWKALCEGCIEGYQELKTDGRNTKHFFYNYEGYQEVYLIEDGDFTWKITSGEDIKSKYTQGDKQRMEKFIKTIRFKD